MSARTVEEMKQPEDGAAAGVARVDRDAELVLAGATSRHVIVDLTRGAARSALTPEAVA